MKHIYKIISLLFIALFFSCNNIDVMVDGVDLEQKDSVTIDLICVDDIPTKAFTPTDNIKDLNIYVFDDKENLIFSEYKEIGAAQSITCEVYVNRKHYIYSIANIGEKIEAMTITELCQKQHSITKLSDLVGADGSVVASAHTGPLLLQGNKSITLSFKRVIARFGYSFDFSKLSADTQVEVKRVSLCNVPNKVFLFKESKALTTEDIIAVGDTREGSDLDLTQKQYLYLFENAQGANLLQDNDSQKDKYFPEGDSRADVCSYFKIEAQYHSPVKSGDIIYRAYIGHDVFTDFNIFRNEEYTSVISFTGNGGVDEVSWRVDVSDLKDFIRDLTLSPTQLEFSSIGAAQQITSTITPATAFNKKLLWSSSDEAVAIVDVIGKVTSVADGSCTISAKTTDGSSITATCAVIVNSVIEPESISIEPKEITLTEGLSAELKATITPANVTDKTITWSSSAESVASVDANGKVTALKVGTATITAKNGGVSGECVVTVAPTVITFTPDNIELFPTQSQQLVWTSVPTGITPTFVSSDESIATVDDAGMVTAIKAGEVTITGTYRSGSGKCTVKVLQPIIEFGGNIDMYAGEYRTVEPINLYPNDPSLIQWSSSDESVATVSSTGEVHTNKDLDKPEPVRITATIYGVSAFYLIKVKKAYIPALKDIALLCDVKSVVTQEFPDIEISHSLGSVAKNARVEYAATIFGTDTPTSDIFITPDGFLMAKDRNVEDYNRPENVPAMKAYQITARVYNNRNELIGTHQSNEIEVYCEYNYYIEREFERPDLQGNGTYLYKVNRYDNKPIGKQYFSVPLIPVDYPIYDIPNLSDLSWEEYKVDYEQYRQGTTLYIEPNLEVSGVRHSPNGTGAYSSKIKDKNLWIYYVSIHPEDYYPR